MEIPLPIVLFAVFLVAIVVLLLNVDSLNSKPPMRYGRRIHR